MQSGLAVVVSNTSAQNDFIKQHPQTGNVYSSVKELSEVLTYYEQNRALLYQAKNKCYQLGQTELNWNNESKKFLKLVEETISKN